MTPQHRGLIPPEHQRAIRQAMQARDDADEALKVAVADAMKAGGSIRQVAEFCGMSTNTIQRWARERGWPTEEQKAAKAAKHAEGDPFRAVLDLAEHLGLPNDDEENADE